MQRDEKTKFENRYPSTLAMVGYRLGHLLFTPIAFGGAFLIRTYRVFFWSDKRWVKWRMLNHITHNYLEWVFDSTTEQEVDQIAGIEVRVVSEKERKNEVSN